VTMISCTIFVAAGVLEGGLRWERRNFSSQADKLVGGSDAVLVIGDTVRCRKKGQALGPVSLRNMLRHLGKTANCQTLVSLDRWAGAGEVPGDGSAAPFPPRELDERFEHVLKRAWRSGRTSNGTDEAGDSARPEIDHMIAAGVRLRLCAGRLPVTG